VKSIQEEVSLAFKKAVIQFPNAKFIVGGHSAGANMAAQLVFHTDPKELNFTSDGHFQLVGAFLVSGIYDLRELVHTTINDALNLSP